ncbi:MAG: (d)CMP kinase [Thiobacillaceae bacterium]
MPVPVIAIDGPAASGKGTVAERVAAHLHFHYLDSGALYRLTALAAIKSCLPLDDEDAMARISANLPARFEEGRILLDGEDVTEALRSEWAGDAASKVAVLPKVRDALLDRQRAYRRSPGLVADGRDMGSVVFPDSNTKVFLTASAETRAKRRHKQLIDKGLSANLTNLVHEMRARDERDAARSVAPLKPAPGAMLLDTTGMSIDDAVDAVLEHYRNTSK